MKKITFTLFALFAFFSSFADSPKIDASEAAVIKKAAQFADKNEAFEYMEKHCENSPAILFNMGNICASHNEHKRAIAYYERALKIMPEFTAALKNATYECAKVGDYKTALQYAAKVSKTSSLDADMYRCIALCHMQSGDYLSALFALNNAIMLDESDILLKKNRLYCLSQLGENVKCIAQAKELVLLDKSDAQSWRMLCAAYTKIGDYKNALAAIKSLQTLNLTNADDYSVMGDLYFNLQMYSFAVDAYKKAGKAVDSERLGRISLLLAKAGEYEIALKIAPDTFFGNIAKGIAYGGKGLFENAEKSFERAFLQTAEPTAEIMCQMGYVLYAQKKYSKAQYYYSKAALDKAFYKSATTMLTKIAVETGDYKTALQLLTDLKSKFNSQKYDAAIESLAHYIKDEKSKN